MAYKKPTYEEYCKASEFAKVRYKFGVYIQFIAMILLFLLFLYAFVNIEEMKSHPAEYAEKKLGVICNPPLVLYPGNYIENGNNRNTENIKEG